MCEANNCFCSILPDAVMVCCYHLTGFMSLHRCLTFIHSGKEPPVTHPLCLGCELRRYFPCFWCPSKESILLVLPGLCSVTFWSDSRCWLIPTVSTWKTQPEHRIHHRGQQKGHICIPPHFSKALLFSEFSCYALLLLLQMATDVLALRRGCLTVCLESLSSRSDDLTFNVIPVTVCLPLLIFNKHRQIDTGFTMAIRDGCCLHERA